MKSEVGRFRRVRRLVDRRGAVQRQPAVRRARSRPGPVPDSASRRTRRDPRDRQLQHRCHRGHIRSRLRLQTEPGLLSRLWCGRCRRSGGDPASHSRAHSVILDAKVGDIGSTAEAYATGYFDTWDFDAVTVNPYLGEDSLAPFLSRRERGVLVVCKTSNPGSADLQNLALDANNGQQPLYLKVADRVAAWAERWPATLGLVVGATYPAELAEVRRRCPHAPILVPGHRRAGRRPGGVAAFAGLDSRGLGLIVSSSRSVIVF